MSILRKIPETKIKDDVREMTCLHAILLLWFKDSILTKKIQK